MGMSSGKAGYGKVSGKGGRVAVAGSYSVLASSSPKTQRGLGVLKTVGMTLKGGT